MLTSPSDGVFSHTKTAPARFLSDSTHCLRVTSKPVCRATVIDSLHLQLFHTASNTTTACVHSFQLHSPFVDERVRS